MKINIKTLRKVIRKVLVEAYEADEDYYDSTALPEEEADSDILAEPDLTDQKERDDYIDNKEKKREKLRKDRLRLDGEIEEDMGDEHAIAGHVGPLGVSGHGPGTKPYGKQKKPKSKNAFGISRPLDEYDE